MSAPRVPTGTVTFLFTDIEGSTRRWQQHPEAMKGALARHHALLQQAIEANGGYVFQIVGDAFCAAFHTAADSVGAALAAQRALAAEAWGEEGPIRVRMAVHTGTAELRAGDHKSGEYASGLTLSHAARLLSVAHGGQILVSSATQPMLREQLPAQVELRDLGRHRLRDIARAEQIFQVVAPGVPSAFPALASLESVPNNLPRQLTSFVGREREIGEVTRLLAGTHLLTATGPGGSGKTRLSLEVAGVLLPDFPDGVWLLELAPVADPALVAQALATTLGVREEAGRPVESTVVDHLRSKRALLVLDNCEHLIDACARLADALLRACPDVKILASSREPLGLTGEVAFRVPPLSVPDPRQVPPLAALTEYEAVRLFVDRAAAAKPDFTLTEASAAPLAQVCQRLDGIPLAIELAAARVRTLSVPQIAAHLDERFRLLTGGSRTALPRHQTLRGLIDWSYGLLADAERALFRRLSAFVGGWTLDAAVDVCAGGGVDRFDVVDLLGRLVDKSLVLMDDHAGDVRYHSLETIRQYALERLAETAEGDAVRARHRDFYLGLAEAAERQLEGPEQVAWLQRLETDHDNFRAALRWSLDAGDTEAALRLGSSLAPFWDTRRYIREGREWLDELRMRAREAPSTSAPGRRALARVLDGAARMRARSSEFAEEIDLLTQSLALWRELGDRRGIAEALDSLADATRLSGDRARGKILVEESLALFRELGDRRGTAHALNNLASNLSDGGDHARARALFEESVPLFEASEDRRGLSHALDNLGGTLTTLGDYAQAEILYGRSLHLAEELEDKHAIATALRSLAGVVHRRGDHARAEQCYVDSIRRFKDMNDDFCLARTLIGFAVASHHVGDHARGRALADQGLDLMRATDAKGELAARLEEIGRVALETGDARRAARCFQEGLRLRAAAGDAPGIAAHLDLLARAAEAGGSEAMALRMLAAADSWRRGCGMPAPEADADARALATASARARLGADAAEAAWSEGAAMSLEAITAYASQHLADLPGT